jgi:putative flippase GtrA
MNINIQNNNVIINNYFTNDLDLFQLISKKDVIDFARYHLLYGMHFVTNIGKNWICAIICTLQCCSQHLSDLPTISI